MLMIKGASHETLAYIAKECLLFDYRWLKGALW